MPLASDWSAGSVGLARPWRAGSSSPPLRPNTVLMAIGEMIGLHRALDRARDRHHEDHEAALGEAVRCHEIARAARRSGAPLPGAGAAGRGRAPARRPARRRRADGRGRAVRRGRRRRRGARRARGRKGPAELLRRRVRRVTRRRRSARSSSPTVWATSACASSPAATPASCSATSAWATGMRGCVTCCGCRSPPGTRGTRRCPATTSPTSRWSKAISTAPSGRSPPRLPRPSRSRRTTASRSRCSAARDRRSGCAPGAPTRRSRTPSAPSTCSQRPAIPNPYLLAMTVAIDVQALLALGRLDEAERTGRRAVDRLGERVPQARSMILTHRRRRSARGRPDRGGLHRARGQRRGRAPRVPGALGPTARARARDAGDTRGAERCGDDGRPRVR